MKRIERIARLFFLVAALCFALSVGTVSASSSQPASEASHAADAGTDRHVGEEQATATAAAHEAAAEEEGHGEGSLSAPKLKDLFWRVVNFIALMIILVKFGAKPIASALAGRQKNIKDELAELEARKAEAETSYREFEAKLSTVEKDIDRIVEKAVAQAEVEKTKIIEKAEQSAEDIQRSAKLAIQNEIMEARRTLKNDVADQAAVMAEGLIIKNLTSDDQVKIIEEYLDKVGAVQ
jgi:F-type H+-transporting ATPase subunit b